MTKDEIIEMVMQIGGCDRPEYDSPALKIFEAFAKLIVRECVKLCEHKSNDDEYDQYDMGQSVKAENIKTSIKQYFGVEEEKTDDL